MTDRKRRCRILGHDWRTSVEMLSGWLMVGWRRRKCSRCGQEEPR